MLATIRRETDRFALYGGEQIVVLSHDTNQQDSEAVAIKALLAIANISLSVESLRVSPTGSIGIATVYSQLDRNSGTLLKRADDALYLAKNKG